MLKIIEFGLLAVSLLVVIGLIVTGSRSNAQPSSSQDDALPKDGPEVQEPGKGV